MRLQPYKQIPLKQLNKGNKLTPKYYSHYKVLHKIGSMAYKLEFPASSLVHLVFHVCFLNNLIGVKIPIQNIFSKIDEEGKVILELEQISKTRTKQVWTWAITTYLMKWKNLPVEDLTWEDESFIKNHPQLTKHWGQHLSEEEGHVHP